MRKTRHITVAVSEDIYIRTRRIAVDYDSTVTAIVAYLLQNLPRLIELIRYPVGGAKAAKTWPLTSPNERESGAIRSLEAALTAPVTATYAQEAPAKKHPSQENQPRTLCPTHTNSIASGNTLENRTAPVRQYDSQIVDSKQIKSK